MSQSLAQLERQVTLLTDLAALPDLSADERTRLIARYQADVESLSAEVEHVRAHLHAAPGGQLDIRLMRKLTNLMRRGRSAEIALGKVWQAAVKAEETPINRSSL